MKPIHILAALVLVAGCDSAAPTSPPLSPPPDPPEILFVVPAPDGFEGTEGGQDLAFSLSSFFESNASAGPVSYTANSTSASIHERVDGDTLRLELVYPGTARIELIAEGRTGVRATGQITVRVVGRCPAAIPSGYVGLFPEPLEVGSGWTYDLRTSSQYSGWPQYRSTGTVRLRVAQASSCLHGQQRLTLSQETVETVEVQNPSTGEWDPEPPNRTSTFYAWVVSDTEIATEAENLRGRPGSHLAPPPFGRRAPRFADPATLSVGVLEVWPSPFGPNVRLRVGVGPFRYWTTTLFGTAGSGNVTWELIGG